MILLNFVTGKMETYDMVAKEKIDLLKKKIDEADAIVVGGASGMSAASGFVFYYQDDDVYKMLAGGLAEKYNIHTISTYFMTGVSAAENFGQACYVPPVIFMSVIQVKLTKIWQNFFKEKIII